MTRKTRKFLCLALASLFVIMSIVPLHARDMRARNITIFEVDGDDIRMTKGAAREFRARAGTSLFDGYTVLTGIDSYAYLRLDDNSIIKMDQQSSVSIGKASRNRLTVNVLSGGISVQVAPQAAGTTFEVRAGNSALAVRGTSFICEINEKDEAIFHMLSGSGEVNGQLLRAGQSLTVHGSFSGGEKNQTLSDFRYNENLSLFTLVEMEDNMDRLISFGVFNESDRERTSRMIHARGGRRGRAAANRRVAPPPVIPGRGKGYMPPVKLNTTALQSAIDTAESLKENLRSASSGAGLSSALRWAPNNVYDAFIHALKEANTALTSAKTQQTINNAEKALLYATSKVFLMGGSGAVDVTAIDILIDDATTLLDELAQRVPPIRISDTNDGTDVLQSEQWVSENDAKIFRDAIALAQDARLNVTSDSKVTSAADSLSDAINVFNNVITSAVYGSAIFSVNNNNYPAFGDIDDVLSAARASDVKELSVTINAAPSSIVPIPAFDVPRDFVTDGAVKLIIGNGAIVNINAPLTAHQIENHGTINFTAGTESSFPNGGTFDNHSLVKFTGNGTELNITSGGIFTNHSNANIELGDAFDNPLLNMNNAEFINNGMVTIASNAVMTFTGGTITNNHGFMVSQSSTFNFKDGTFNNKSLFGIFDTAVANFEGGTFNNNPDNAAGIFMLFDIDDVSWIVNGTKIYNHAGGVMNIQRSNLFVPLAGPQNIVIYNSGNVLIWQLPLSLDTRASYPRLQIQGAEGGIISLAALLVTNDTSVMGDYHNILYTGNFYSGDKQNDGINDYFPAGHYEWQNDRWEKH
jgi:hypothetical protein